MLEDARAFEAFKLQVRYCHLKASSKQPFATLQTYSLSLLCKLTAFRYSSNLQPFFTLVRLILEDACWALSYLSDGTKDRIQALINAGLPLTLLNAGLPLTLLIPAAPYRPSLLTPATRAHRY
jgi:hypothetical protein